MLHSPDPTAPQGGGGSPTQNPQGGREEGPLGGGRGGGGGWGGVELVKPPEIKNLAFCLRGVAFSML